MAKQTQQEKRKQKLIDELITDFGYTYDKNSNITDILFDHRPGTADNDFTYDALGRRIHKYDAVADESMYYYYNDKWQVLAEHDGSADFGNIASVTGKICKDISITSIIIQSSIN